MTAFVPESIRILGTDGGGLSVVLCSMYVDTLADLPAQTAYAGFRLSMGCTARVINDNSRHRLNSAGQWVDITENDGKYTLPPATSNSLGGIMVGSGLTIDSAGMLSGDFSALWDSIYQTEKHLTGVPPLSFMASGNGIEAAVIYGNGQQTGTPTPDAPIMPTFCGKLDGTDWTIPLTCAGQIIPVYLGEVPTVRRVKKLVFDGTEKWTVNTSGANTFRGALSLMEANINFTDGYCTHVPYIQQGISRDIEAANCNGGYIYLRLNRSIANDLNEFKSYLAAQYTNGTPVTVWYVLATEQTGIVNEPLCKIGDYADELHSADAGISIQTVRGQNTLTIGTTLQPSKISITYF